MFLAAEQSCLLAGCGGQSFCCLLTLPLHFCGFRKLINDLVSGNNTLAQDCFYFYETLLQHLKEPQVSDAKPDMNLSCQFVQSQINSGRVLKQQRHMCRKPIKAP